MISYLEGIIKYKTGNFLTLLIGGVGFKVFVPLDLLTNTVLNKKIALFIHTEVKEDALDLYGFPDPSDLAFFELLLGVSGIGPKTALAIFSHGKLSKIKEAIIKGDVDFFTGVPRLGRKNAQKIIIEIRSKLGNLEDLDLTAENSETKEIVEALRSFGFTSFETKEAFKAIKDFQSDTSGKIREALKYLGKK